MNHSLYNYQGNKVYKSFLFALLALDRSLKRKLEAKRVKSSFILYTIVSARLPQTRLSFAFIYLCC